jgi:4-hydroxy 2-oxovalerate aldolase
MKTTPVITDSSLRDGSHPMRHSFTCEQVRDVASALDDAGVPVIEVSHGDGLGGSSLQYGSSSTDEMDLIETAYSVCKRAKIAVLLLPGVGTKEELREASRRGANVVRIATQCTEADVSCQHFGLARSLGMEAIGFLMMAHMRPAAELVRQALLMQEYGATCVYVVDSAGAMLPRDVKERVSEFRQTLSCEVGFHAHNNLGLAVGNSVAAIEAGATRIDGCLRGLGAGSGNAPTELLAAVLEKSGFSGVPNVFKLCDAAEFVLAPMMPFQPIPNRDAITIGYAGVYSTFLLHARTMGARFGLDPRDILVELGKRKAMAGQEDWILDVAQDLAASRHS